MGIYYQIHYENGIEDDKLSDWLPINNVAQRARARELASTKSSMRRGQKIRPLGNGTAGNLSRFLRLCLRYTRARAGGERWPSSSARARKPSVKIDFPRARSIISLTRGVSLSLFLSFTFICARVANENRERASGALRPAYTVIHTQGRKILSCYTLLSLSLVVFPLFSPSLVLSFCVLWRPCR